jgi:ADP-heptose:LPS heptosyltransferase
MVITPDTSLVHLAGAMGKDTVLLLDFLSDWRWFTPKNGQPSVWYSSVKTFIRQKEMSWTDVVGSLNL